METSEWDEVAGWHGLYVGQLTDEEIELFNRAVSLGYAFRDYGHAGGLQGFAKVGVRSKGKERRG